MDMSQIYLIIGIVLLTFEMFTGGFYLFILGLSLILSSRILYLFEMLSIGFNHITLISISFIIFNIIGFLILKKYKQFNNLNKKREAELNIFSGIGKSVLLNNDSFNEESSTIKCRYSGTIWDAKFVNLNNDDIEKIKKKKITIAYINNLENNMLILQIDKHVN